MRNITEKKLKIILESHRHWLERDCYGCEKMRADLSYADLSNADLSNTDLRHAKIDHANLDKANLSNANLENADLRETSINYANLNNANLDHADLRHACINYSNLSNVILDDADLRHAKIRYTNLDNADLYYADIGDVNFSGAKNLLSSIDYLKENFEFTEDGVIAYKIFNVYSSPEEWVIQSGSIITENCNSNRADVCGCGINVAPLEWVRKNCVGEIWKLLIRWEWLAGVVVPYNTDGKIRCERAELIEIVETNEK